MVAFHILESKPHHPEHQKIHISWIESIGNDINAYKWTMVEVRGRCLRQRQFRLTPSHTLTFWTSEQRWNWWTTTRPELLYQQYDCVQDSEQHHTAAQNTVLSLVSQIASNTDSTSYTSLALLQLTLWYTCSNRQFFQIHSAALRSREWPHQYSSPTTLTLTPHRPHR